MANKIQRDSDGFIMLTPKPDGPVPAFIRKYYSVKIPKDSDDMLHKIQDMKGSEDIKNMSEVPIGDYVYRKGVIFSANMNVGRAIPWLDDGFKSVERRALFIMWKRGYYGKSSAKVSSIVGAMIENVYPHGDAASDTIYRLGNHRRTMLPYIQELANYGNMKDFRPAAPRYGVASLSEYAMDCFFKEMGPKRPLYDEKDTYDYKGKEPVYLNSRYPNILMQWNLGIGKGAMSWLGAFNSKDIFETTLKLMDDPHAPIEIYPDCPIPVEIVNKAELKNCFDDDNFKVKMRAPYVFEVDQRAGSGGRIENVYQVVFTALPIGVNGNRIAGELNKLKEADTKSKTKRFPEMLDYHIETPNNTDGGIRFIIEYERGYDPNVLVEKLYKSTSLASTVSVQYKLIVENRPRLLSPREILLFWINQRYDQKRRYCHQMAIQAAKDRAIYEALDSILQNKKNTDDYLNIVRGSKDDDESVAKLRERFGFTDFQARSVLEIKVKTLQKLNIEDIRAKRDKAIEDYKYYRKLLSSDKAIKEVIRDELEKGLKKYGKSRMAKVKNIKVGGIGEDKDQKILIYNSDYYFCIDNVSDIAKIQDKLNPTYRMVKLANADNVMIVDRSGAVKGLNGYAFSLNIGGISMNTLAMKDVVAIIPEKSKENYDGVVLVTKLGYGKRMEIHEFMKTPKGHVISLNSDDALVAAVPVKSDYHPDSVIAMFQDDRFYYVHLYDFPVYKRASAGNRIVKNVKDICLNGATFLETSDETDYLFIYAEGGNVKLFDTSLLTFSKRGYNMISLQGKNIIDAVLINKSSETLKLICGHINGAVKDINIEIGKMVKFTPEGKEEQKFRMSTSIGSPVKVLKLNRGDWYKFIK